MKYVRGFEVVKGKEEDGINLPKRQTKNSAGYDFEAAEDTIIPSIWKLMAKRLIAKVSPFIPNAVEFSYDGNAVKPTLVKTGVKAYMQEDEALYLYNRSSNPIKRFLLLSNGVGVIDSDYYNNPDNDGEIMFQFINFGLHPVTIKKGERIGQGVFKKFLKADNDKATGERKGGHGST